MNIGYIRIGTSHDTAEFICDCIFEWWHEHGRMNYPNASSILLLCDSGGSNNAKHYIFKEHLQNIVDRIGIEIRICHFPSYCSKYNPIEHLLFSHVSRACQGVILRDIQILCELMRKTHNQSGVKVFVDINEKFYESGKQASKEFRDNMPLLFDEYLPLWNYTAIPKGSSVSPFYSLTAIRDNLFETKASIKRTLEILESNS